MLPALLLGAATLLLLGRTAPGRLDDVVPQAVSARTSSAAPRPGPQSRGSTVLGQGRAVQVACVLAGAALALVVGGPVGAIAGAVTALAGPRLLTRLEPREVRRGREELSRDLPLALDLLSACLAGGAPLPAAVSSVADAVPGACGQRLSRVATALRVGSPSAEAWAELVDGSSGLGGSAARALARSGETGAPVAAAVARLAADTRAEARARAEAAAKRAGVLAVAPLGLCFLPAFVLIGVVPVVVGLAAPLLRTL